MNAQATSFSDLEKLSDLDAPAKPTFLEAQQMAAERHSVRQHTSRRYGNTSRYNTSRLRVVQPAPAVDNPRAPADVMAKLRQMADRRSKFAIDVLGYFDRNGVLADGHIRAVKKIIADDAARDVTRNTVAPVTTTTHATTNAIDLTNVPEGRYAVPNGETRLKVLIKKPGADTNWNGFIFVSDAAEYGQRQKYGMQKPGQTYYGKIQDQLRAIVANQREAAIAYGKLTGTCGCCGRKLEDAESVARGIGPICAEKHGW